MSATISTLSAKAVNNRSSVFSVQSEKAKTVPVNRESNNEIQIYAHCYFSATDFGG